jgi:hypothetical protein
MGSSGHDWWLYAPVINDVSFRIILIGMMVWNLKAKIIHIETTFLYGDLEESIFMEIPSGMEVGNGKCLVLKKKIMDLCRVLNNFISNLSKHWRVVDSQVFSGSLSMGQAIQFTDSYDGNLCGWVPNYWI